MMFVDKKGWEGIQRQDKEEKERKSVLGERRKRKAATPKAQTHKSKNNSFLPFLLFSLTSPLFSFFSRFKIKARESTEITDKKDVNTQSVGELEILMAQEDMDTKRELARRLIEGNGVPQNHPKAVALLEDCVALGDADAMLMLAKCCALGHGMDHDAERAESLISEAANKGNHEALCLMELINEWEGTDNVDLSSLSCSHRKMLPRKFIKFLTQGKSRVN